MKLLLIIPSLLLLVNLLNAQEIGINRIDNNGIINISSLPWQNGSPTENDKLDSVGYLYAQINFIEFNKREYYYLTLQLYNYDRVGFVENTNPIVLFLSNGNQIKLSIKDQNITDTRLITYTCNFFSNEPSSSPNKEDVMLRNLELLRASKIEKIKMKGSKSALTFIIKHDKQDFFIRHYDAIQKARK